mmetsp:Transcript_2765/g.6048  ORF Transcript_2765/g.6048 Transcript_2765/m.6048 type:complete len:113 (-) Transcript_2765:77-415(-)
MGEPLRDFLYSSVLGQRPPNAYGTTCTPERIQKSTHGCTILQKRYHHKSIGHGFRCFDRLAHDRIVPPKNLRRCDTHQVCCENCLEINAGMFSSKQLLYNSREPCNTGKGPL